MAFREIAINFSSVESDLAKDLNLSVAGPFAWYMDGVMRGRFKDYAGDEVKGIQLVNLCCYSPMHAEMMRANSGHDLESRWVNLLNTYRFDLELDLELFNGSQEQNIVKAIELFIDCASSLNIPSMVNLVAHTKESIGVNSIEKAIEKNRKEAEKSKQKMEQVKAFL